MQHAFLILCNPMWYCLPPTTPLPMSPLCNACLFVYSIVIQFQCLCCLLYHYRSIDKMPHL